jgi:hypothetical protein
MSRNTYDKIVAIVDRVIRRWDPYGLLAGGAPSDEFDQEVAMVAARAKQIKTEADSIVVLSAVFSSQFEQELFTPERCASPGSELFRELKGAGFLE